MAERKAIILAAGQGKRLRPITAQKPKTLVEVGEKTILDKILHNLEENDFEEAIIVTGYREKDIRDHLKNYNGLKLTFIKTDKPKETDNIYDLWRAREKFEEGFYIINSDTIFSSKDLSNLVSGQNSRLLVDLEKGQKDEEMKVKTDENKVIDIGKTIERGDGEYIGVAKISKDLAKDFKENIDQTIQEGKTKEWYELVFKNLLKKNKEIKYTPTKQKWMEIDNKRDLEKARKNFQDL